MTAGADAPLAVRIEGDVTVSIPISRVGAVEQEQQGEPHDKPDPVSVTRLLMQIRTPLRAS